MLDRSLVIAVLFGVLVGLSAGLLIRGTGNAPAPAAAGAGYADAVARAAPAVVNIYTTRIVTARLHPICDLPSFRDFCERLPSRRQRMQGSLGSGVIVTADGYVITNNHVIADADEILVALQDGREAAADVVGTDPETDLAILRIDLPELSPIDLPEQPGVRIGDVVLAIGNPFGIGQTVSQGIISAMGRYGLSSSPYEDFIQTDAAINPGNSGGALIDVHGDLVGINTLIFSRSGGSQGLGFAIPTNVAMSVLDDILTEGRVVRGWLGVDVLPRPAGAEPGLRVAAVTPDGPAAGAGLRPGDLIVAVDGQAVTAAREVIQRIAMMEPGSRVVLRVERQGSELDLPTVVGLRPASG